MHRDKDALRALAAEAPTGETLLCEKRLARAGVPLGFAAAEPPAWGPLPRAALAAVLALGPDIVDEEVFIARDGGCVLIIFEIGPHWLVTRPARK
jgi:hypothetical protein